MSRIQNVAQALYRCANSIFSGKHKHSEQVSWQLSTVSKLSRLSTKSSKAATNSSNREHHLGHITSIPSVLIPHQIHWRINTDQQNHISCSTQEGQESQCEVTTMIFHLQYICLLAAFDTRRFGKSGLPSAWQGLLEWANAGSLAHGSVSRRTPSSFDVDLFIIIVIVSLHFEDTKGQARVRSWQGCTLCTPFEICQKVPTGRPLLA